MNQYIDSGVKIGARVLERDVVLNTLPNYNSIADQIEIFRKEAFKVNKEYKKIDEKLEGIEGIANINRAFRRHFDNVISILGSRGAGKTSILLTLLSDRMNEIKEKSLGDIILSPVIPEDMSSSSDALGWIISALEIYVKDFDQDKRNKGYSDYIKPEKNELEYAYKKLLQSYLFRRKIFHQLVNTTFVDTLEYIDDNKQVLNADQNLMEHFRDFIEKLIEKRKRLYNKENVDDSMKEPMIFITFDDVDISAERCPDVLDTIIKYLSHQNIVVFISGDYRTFIESCTLDFLAREKVLDERLINKDFSSLKGDEVKQDILTSMKIRSQKFLEKIMPPAYRYNTPKMNYWQKLNFRYYANGNNDKFAYMNIFELLEEIYGKNLLKYGDEYIYLHLDLFGNTPRELINVYYYLYTMAKKNKDDKVIIAEINSKLQELISIIIGSNEEFIKHESVINSYIYSYSVLTASKKSSVKWVVDYDYLHQSFLSRIGVLKYDEESEKAYAQVLQLGMVIQEYVRLIVLGVFIQKVLSLFGIDSEDERNNKNIQGMNASKVFYIIINIMKQKAFPAIDSSDIEFLFVFYFNLTYEVSINRIKNLDFDEDCFEDKIEEPYKDYRMEKLYLQILERSIDTSKYDSINHFFDKVYETDPEWVEEKVSFIFSHYWTNFKIFDYYKEKEISWNVDEKILDTVIKDVEIENFEMLKRVFTKEFNFYVKKLSDKHKKYKLQSHEHLRKLEKTFIKSLLSGKRSTPGSDDTDTDILILCKIFYNYYTKVIEYITSIADMSNSTEQIIKDINNALMNKINILSTGTTFFRDEQDMLKGIVLEISKKIAMSPYGLSINNFHEELREVGDLLKVILGDIAGKIALNDVENAIGVEIRERLDILQSIYGDSGSNAEAKELLDQLSRINILSNTIMEINKSKNNPTTEYFMRLINDAKEYGEKPGYSPYKAYLLVKELDL